jgi:Cu2+-exporting ATPase
MNLPETCIHCNLPIPHSERVMALIDGEDLHFCCHGCEGAYRIIKGAGLEDFYTKRNWQEPGVPQGVFDSRFSDSYLQHFVTLKQGKAEISLLLEGKESGALPVSGLLSVSSPGSTVSWK